MKRPLFVAGISYFVATWLAFLFGESLEVKLAILAALTGVLLVSSRKKSRRFRVAGLILLSAAMAFTGLWLYGERQMEPMRELAGRLVVIEGIITEVSGGPSGSYTMRANFVEHPELGDNVPLIIRTYGGTEYSEGDAVRLKTRLKPAPESLWYRSRGIYLIGQNIMEDERISARNYSFERAAIRLRVILSRNVYARLPEQNANIVAAMVLGLKNNIPPETYSAVARSGTSHLLSVSGLHLAILSAFVLAALKAVKCSRRLSAAIAITVSFLFVVLTGFSASTLRAFIMTAISLSGRIVSRRSDSMTSLGFAMLVCSIVWPYWALSWSLWLSAGSTLGIIMFGGKLSDAVYNRIKPANAWLDKIIQPISNALGLSIGAYAFTVPVLLLMNGWVSLISPLANILILPFVPLSIFGGIMCAVMPQIPVLTGIIAAVTSFSTWIIVRISEILGSLPFAIIAIDESWMLLWLMLLCACVAVLLIYREKRLAGYAAALIVLSFSIGNLSLELAGRNKVEVVTFASRNAAVLLRGNEAVILGTPDMYEISNLLGYLDYRGVKKLSAVIAADSGEAVGSGMLRIIERYDTDCVIAPNDAYITEMLVRALPDIHVLSGGYAEITAFGGVIITTDLQNDNIYIAAGKNRIVKIRAECDIIESGDGWIRIYDSGALALPKHVYAAFEPVGAHLFGESRVILNM